MSRHEFRRKIDAIKATISLRDLVERDGHKVTHAGGCLWRACCPFHRERTSSFYIYPDNHAHCFGCGFHGDVFHYVMKRDNCDFKTAVERLDNGTIGAPRAVQKVIHRPTEPELPRYYFSDFLDKCMKLNDNLAFLDFCDELGVKVEAMASLVVFYCAQEKAWAFPMQDHTRHIIGIRLRDENGKKWAVKGSKQGLFIPIDKPANDLYVTEGPTDCAAMLSMGLFAIGKAAAMQGPEEIIKFVEKNGVRRVIVIADNDRAGLNGAKKLLDACPVPCCELVLPAKDAREFYRNGGTREIIESLLKAVVWRHPKNVTVHK